MKFIVTKELGRLSKWLRILGFDTVYFKEDNKGVLLLKALRENRIIISRSQRISTQTGLKVVNIKSQILKSQIKQLQDELKIGPDKEKIFSRCVVCNLELKFISKEKTKEQVPAYVYQTQDQFYTCEGCGRVYWQGTHWGNVTKIIEEIA